MEKTTHRQYEAWSEWLDEQWNRPDRSDHYVMALVLEVRNLTQVVAKALGGKGKADMTFESVKVKFKTKAGPKRREDDRPVEPLPEQERKDKAAISRSVWLRAMKDSPGLKIIPPPDGPIPFDAPAASQRGRP